MRAYVFLSATLIGAAVVYIFWLAFSERTVISQVPNLILQIGAFEVVLAALSAWGFIAFWRSRPAKSRD